MVDIIKEHNVEKIYPSRGRALDQWESSPIHRFDTKLTGSVDYDDTVESDVCFITALVTRRPGMSRDDLLEISLFFLSYLLNPPVSPHIINYIPKCGLFLQNGQIFLKEMI